MGCGASRGILPQSGSPPPSIPPDVGSFRSSHQGHECQEPSRIVTAIRGQVRRWKINPSRVASRYDDPASVNDRCDEPSGILLRRQVRWWLAHIDTTCVDTDPENHPRSPSPRSMPGDYVLEDLKMESDPTPLRTEQQLEDLTDYVARFEYIRVSATPREAP